MFVDIWKIILKTQWDAGALKRARIEYLTHITVCFFLNVGWKNRRLIQIAIALLAKIVNVLLVRWNKSIHFWLVLWLTMRIFKVQPEFLVQNMTKIISYRQPLQNYLGISHK